MDLEAPYKVKNVRWNTFEKLMAKSITFRDKVFPLTHQAHSHPIPLKSRDHLTLFSSKVGTRFFNILFYTAEIDSIVTILLNLCKIYGLKLRYYSYLLK